MKPLARPLTYFEVLECVLGFIVAAFAGYQVWFFLTNGYLSQPFFYDTNDTLMDFYNTAYWSHIDGAYTVWNSIYPPLSFALLRLVTPAQCYREDAMIGRECDSFGWLILVVGTFCLGWVLKRQSKNLPVAVMLARIVTLCVGLPTLFCLERGNLLLLAAPALLYGLTRQKIDWTAALALAFAINLKPYLVLLTLAIAINHGWRDTVRTLFASTALYLFSVIVVGDGLPWQILNNVVTFTGDGVVNFWEKFYFSSSFSPFIRILASDLPLDAYLGTHAINQLLTGMSMAMASSGLATLAALIAATILPPLHRQRILVTAAVLCFALVLTESFGGYTVMLLIALLFALPAQGSLLSICLVICYLLSIPFDYMFIIVRNSEASIWLSGLEVETQYGITVGQGLRPALILLMQLMLCAAIVVRCWRHYCEKPAPTAS